MSYGDYLATKIFKPLGMKSNFSYIYLGLPQRKLTTLTKGYITNNANGRVMPVGEMGMDYFKIYLDGS